MVSEGEIQAAEVWLEQKTWQLGGYVRKNPWNKYNREIKIGMKILMPSREVKPQSMNEFWPTIVEGYLHVIKTTYYSKYAQDNKQPHHIQKTKAKRCLEGDWTLNINPSIDSNQLPN